MHPVSLGGFKNMKPFIFLVNSVGLSDTINGHWLCGLNNQAAVGDRAKVGAG